MAPLILVRSGLLGLLIALIGLLSVWCENMSGSLESLDHGSLATAIGLDVHLTSNSSLTCDQNTTASVNQSNPDLPPSVATDGCTAANSGQTPATQCISCDPPGGNVELQVFRDNNNTYSGLQFGQTDDCGPMSLGQCQIVQGIPTCTSLRDSGATCYQITEWWVQSQGGS